ncbi:MAG TPA: inverse autotransporter beta domain-containing protein [Thermodesulfobacteriota bacterium]|nr:inverse autotransporter beta domain-containing protein [Thermodesulfobacteriota bacterium]
MRIYLDIQKGYKYLFFTIFILLFSVASSTVMSEEMDKDSRIRELERKLEAVSQEVNKLKEQQGVSNKISEIEDKLTVLVEEIENIKSSSVTAERKYEQKHGHAEGASQVYHVGKGFSVGGYGELFISQIEEDDDNTVDTQRVILYVGHKFTDNIIFNSEIEFEHGTTSSNQDGRSGSASVEFASIDFLISESFNIRGGLLLAPFGIVNEQHEPTTFFGVLRPDIETQIIPTTWRESGAGIFGEINDVIPGTLSYRAYLMNSFDSRGFRASNNRSLRVKGNRARFNDIAFVSRLEYDPIPGVKFGGSWFIGQTGQNESVDGQTIGGLFQMYEGDVDINWRGFEGRALFVYTFLDDAELINAQNGLVGDDSVGEEQFGWYVQGAYNIMSLADVHPYFQYLAPFVRYEQYDTQKDVPAGFLRNPANDRDVLTFGLNYKPIPNVVVKVDYQVRDDEADSSNNQINLGLGYVF